MPRKFALLISNNRYRNGALSQLSAPTADAHALYPLLCDPAIGGFPEENVTILFDAGDGEIRDAIARFFADKQHDDLLLLYFSDHGLLDEWNRLYLATAESDPHLPQARSIPASYLQQEMDDSRSRRQLLILDSCFAGAFRRGITKSGLEKLNGEATFGGNGRVILAASGATEYAYEGGEWVGDSDASLFTHYLAEGLKTGAADRDRDGWITANDLHDYASTQVQARQPAQTPVRWNFAMNSPLVVARSPYWGETAAPADERPPPTTPTYRTHIVDPLHRGDYTIISAAIAAADPGDRIKVRRGYYQEELVIDKPLQIIAQGEPGEVELVGKQGDTIHFAAAAGEIWGLTIRQESNDNCFAVKISEGRLTLEECDISSRALACVAIQGDAAPILRRNHIHDSAGGGIFVYDGGQGLLEENEVYGNSYDGIEIMTGGTPTIRANRIYDNKESGLFIHDKGQGILEENEIYDNSYDGISVSRGSTPTIRGNHIHDNKEFGLYVYDGAQGLLEENEIHGNGYGGISIKTGGAPTVHANRIHDNEQSGVYVNEKGQGLLEENEIYNNGYAGVEIETGGIPTVRYNRINQNGYEGVWIHKEGGGVFEENDLTDNEMGAWDIDESSQFLVTRSGNKT